MYAVYFWPLSVEGQSKVMLCISNLRRPFILKRAGRRTKMELKLVRIFRRAKRLKV